MSNLRTSQDGAREVPGLSLTQAAVDVRHHGLVQGEALKEKQGTLACLQATLSELERRGKLAEHRLRSRLREVLVLEGDAERLGRRAAALHERCASAGAETAELWGRVAEEEAGAGAALAGFRAYREKMEAHRAAALRAASQTEAHKGLREREALREESANPDGNTATMAKREIDALKEEVSAAGKITAERGERLKKEFETHAQIKKDIEIQNRRHEAIVKRLHCQLSRAQAAHREMSDDVDRMERRLAELKGRQESSLAPKL